MSAEPRATRPKKSRRFTAPPQKVSTSNLVGVFELPHGAGRPGSGVTDQQPEALVETCPGAGPGLAKKKEGHGTVEAVLEQRAADDDPRRWGDAEEDLGDWMKSQRPPHWD